MSFLLDTNVISELRKRERCDPAVAAWFASVPADQLFTSVLVLGEIRKGVEGVRGRDPAKAQALDHWLQAVETGFGDRVLDVTLAVADQWGRMNAGRTLPVVDGLIAATAVVHDLTLVTRNEDDVKGLEVSVLNPFRA